MQRRKLFLLSGLTVALTGGLVGTQDALAERLGGAYRGPEDIKTTKDTGTASSSDSSQNPEGGPQSGGSTGGSDQGGGVSDSGGGSGGGSSGGGDGGGDDGGGGASAPPSGGDGGGDVAGGGASGGGTSTGGGSSTGGAPAKSGSGGVGSGSAAGAGRGKGGTDTAQEQLMVVSWYFEHNRERLIGEVAQARSRQLRPHKGSVAALLSVLPHDARERSDVTVEDRERIFDLLNKNTLAAEDVVRDAAVIALGKIGTPDAVQILRRRLDEESKWDIKEDIVLALGIARSPDAIEALAATLKSNRTRLHPYALLALGLTQDPERAGPVVFEHLQADLKRVKQSQDTVAAACMALGNLGYVKAEPALIAAARSKSTPDFVKVYLAQTLGRFATDDGRKAIESLLGSSDEDVARAALLALGNYADGGAAKALAGKDGLGRPDPLCAGFAALSLGKVLNGLPEGEWKKFPDEIRDVAMSPQKSSIKSQYANLALSFFDGGVDGDVRRRYSEEIKNGSKLPPEVIASMAMACGVGTVTGLESSLREIAEGSGSDPKLAGYAALSLGMTGNPAATAPVLRRIYQAGEGKPDVQRGAVLGLGLVGDRKDVPFLLDVIVRTDASRPFAQYTRGAAVMALGLIRDGESVARIQELLRNPDPLVRAYAIAALGHIADKDAAPVMPKLFEHANFRQEFLALKIAMRTL